MPVHVGMKNPADGCVTSRSVQGFCEQEHHDNYLRLGCKDSPVFYGLQFRLIRLLNVLCSSVLVIRVAHLHSKSLQFSKKPLKAYRTPAISVVVRYYGGPSAS